MRRPKSSPGYCRQLGKQTFGQMGGISQIPNVLSGRQMNTKSTKMSFQQMVRSRCMNFHGVASEMSGQ